MTIGYWTDYRLGTLASAPGEDASIIRPKHYRGVPQLPGVMFVHGAGSNSAYCLDATGRQGELTRKIALSGRHGFSHQNGGPATWGNDTALARMDAGYAWMHANLPIKSGKIALVSASMGGLNSLAWAARNPDKVACIASVIPVIDVTDIHGVPRLGGAYTYDINIAYGGWTEAAYGATHNPLTLAKAGKYAGIPILFYYGLTDALCVPAKTEEFAAVVGSNVELVSLPSGHDFDSYNAVNHDHIVEFLQQHAGP